MVAVDLPEMMIRTSERTCFKRCRMQWKWGYLERLDSMAPSRHLRLGTLVHEALAKFYKPGVKRGPRPAGVFAKMVDADVEKYGPMIFKDADDPDKRLDGKTLGLAMLEGYYEEYGKDERYEIIRPEMKFQLDVHDANGRYLFTYVGTMDAVIRDLVSGRIGLFEHKTGARMMIPTPFALDEQAGSYWAFAPDFLRSLGILDEDENVDFVLYNFLRKALPDERPRDKDGYALNQNGTISKRQPAPRYRREEVYKSDAARRNLMIRIKKEAADIRKAREGKLRIYKNPADHCNWCEFKDMCEVHEEGSDWRSIKQAMFSQWDPYEAHDTEVRV